MTFTIRIARPEDGPGICRLFGKVFPREMTLEEWLWKYPRNPDGWLSVVAEVGGEIAGHYGGWGAKVIVDGGESVFFSLCDLSTDPAARRLGGRHAIFRSMAEEWNGLLGARGQPFSYGFPGPHALEVGGPLVGYRAHFPVRELRFPIGQGGTRGPEGADSVDPSFDRLWKAARPRIDAGLVRDRERVNWRFHARPDRYYRMVSLGSEAGECLAWAALSVLGPDALVMDFLAADAEAETFEGLWAALAAEALGMGARELVFWEPPGGPWREALRRQVARLGGGSVEAGFSFATAVINDERALGRFVSNVHLTPSFYDDR